MKERNAQLKSALGAMASKEIVKEVNNIPVEDTVNRQGFAAYSLSDELRLISMLNTLKLEPQYYRSENDTMRELRDLIEKIGLRDPYFLCQAIVYSRCMGEGMRSINHLAATLAAPFIAGQPFAKAFYGLFDKKNKRGGVIYRTDDMSEMKDVWMALNGGRSLPNAMKKGFATAIEGLDAYQLTKYRKSVIDVSNLVHPKSTKSLATVLIDGKNVKVIDALMNGVTITADTWESANSEAGQEVAKAIKEGKVSKEEGAKILAEAKNDNWESLLLENKLGILAALRNIRSMLKSPRKSVIDALCNLLSNANAIRNGMIMPYQIDTAYEILREEFSTHQYFNKVAQALLDGYETSVPNLAVALPGKTCVLIDCSGSMSTACYNGSKRMRNATACEKAGLIAATIAKATNADVVRFGSRAEVWRGNRYNNVFEMGKDISRVNMGGTSIAAAFNAINGKVYDRIILLSDYEANTGSTTNAYKNYLRSVNNSPYVYCVDFAAYGTAPLKNADKVKYFYGYGYAMFDDIAATEFNPMNHIDKIRKVVVDPNYTNTKKVA